MRRLLVVFLSALAVVPAMACTCGSYEPQKACQLLASFPVVFRGRAIDHNDDGSGRFTQLTLYRFEVKEIFRGLSPGTKTVFLDPESMSSCYGGFQLGKDYLIYASGGGNASTVGAIAVTVARNGSPRKPAPAAWSDFQDAPVYRSGGSCSPSRLVAEKEDEDLEYLRRSVSGANPKTGWIEGRVVQNLEWPVTTRNLSVVADASLTLTDSEGKSRTERAQPNGTFQFDAVPAGAYQLTAESPTMGQGKLFGPPKENPVMPSGGCRQVIFSFESRATISGVVLDDNSKPMAGQRLDVGELLPDGRVRVVPRTWADSDQLGRFVMKSVPAAVRVVVAANLNGAPNKKEPFDTVYAPGIQRLSQARIFEAKAGENIHDVVLRLPPSLPFGDLVVEVVWPDGSPAYGAGAVARWNRARAASGSSSANSNRVILPLALGRTYEVEVDWFALRSPLVKGVAPPTVAFTASGQSIKLALRSPLPEPWK